MSIHIRLTVSVALCFLLSSLPVLGQDKQKSEQKGQVTSSAPAVSVSRPARVRLGGFSFSAGYGRYFGRLPYYSFYPYPYYRSWFYDPFYPSFYGLYSPLWYHPGWYSGFAWQPGMGEVKLRSSLQDADVFLNDGWAGKARDLKTIWLEPGAYDLKVQADKWAPFTMRIYVLSGKTMKVDARLAPQKEPES